MYKNKIKSNKVFVVSDDNDILSGEIYGHEFNTPELQLKLDNGLIGWFSESEIFNYYDEAESYLESKFNSNNIQWNP